MRRLLYLLVLIGLFASRAPAQTFTFPTQPQNITGFTLTTSALTGGTIDLRGADVHWSTVTWRATGTVTTATCLVDYSEDAATWTNLTSNTCTSNGETSTATANDHNYIRIRTPNTFAGSGSVLVTHKGWTQNPYGTVTVSGAVTATGCTSSTCTDTVVQSTASNLNAQVQGAASDGTSASGIKPIMIGAQAGSSTISSLSVITNRGDHDGTRDLSIVGAGFDGSSTYQRQRIASLANSPVASTLTARNESGVTLVDKPASWGVTSAVAVGSQGTITIAAESAVRHVADCVGWSAAATTAPTATALTINLRDGASGAGTVLRTWSVAVTATTGNLVPAYDFCGLNLTGTTATAMTLEFSAGVTNVQQTVSLSGRNVN